MDFRSLSRHVTGARQEARPANAPTPVADELASRLPRATDLVRSERIVTAALLDRHLATAIAEFTPTPPKEATMTTTPGTSATAIKDLMEEHVRLMGAIHQAQLETLRASLARQRDTVTNAVGAVAQKIDGQTSDFLAMVGQFSNDLG